MNLLEIFRLLLLSITIKIFTQMTCLPGHQFDTFIRVFSLKNFKKIGITRALLLFLNPISSIRYFEFDFVINQLGNLSGRRILDVSSPRFFGLYLAKKNKDMQYQMINPDKKDVLETKTLKKAFSNIDNFNIAIKDAQKLPYKSSSFDHVISISVIEHISKSGDTKAVREMWRVLRPGGKLIITTHIMKKSRVEYREVDQYGLDKNKKKKKYFFQRVYSENSLRKRIINAIGVKPKRQVIWGEKYAGWFDKYIQRWIRYKIKETIYDPLYMLVHFKKFSSVSSLAGIGVIGLVFQKPLKWKE